MLPSACTLASQRNPIIIANEHNWDVRPIDVKTAYLQRKKKTEVYVHLPHRYTKINSKGYSTIRTLRKQKQMAYHSPRRRASTRVETYDIRSVYFHNRKEVRTTRSYVHLRRGLRDNISGPTRLHRLKHEIRQKFKTKGHGKTGGLLD